MANVITTLLKMDSTQFKTGMKSAQQSIKETDGVVNKAKTGWASMWSSFAASPIAIGAASAAVGAFATSSVKAASDLDESINAVNVTFGESSDKILEFGKNAAKSVGLANAEFNQLATPLGSILKNSGFDLDTTADKTIELTQRAADMASVFNTDVSDALGAIQAGLRGEQDPLERFGVGLSAAKVEARALADTGKRTAKELTDQEKALARIDLILDQTNQTAGDFANTSDGLANQTRILKAEFTDLQASVGRQLIPALSDLAGALIDIRDAAGLAKGAIEGLPGGSSSLGLLARAVNDTLNPVGALNDAAGDLKDKLFGGSDSVAAGFDVVSNSADLAKGALALSRTEMDYTSTAADRYVESLEHMATSTDELADSTEQIADLFANKWEDSIGAVEAAFGELEGTLDELDMFDDIKDSFDSVAEAQKKMLEGGEAEARDYNREVRQLQRQLLDLVTTTEGLSEKEKIDFAVQIRTGDVDTMNRVLDELTQDRYINIGVRGNPQQAFSSLNGVFSPGAAPSGPIFAGSNPAPSSGYTDNRNITIINPIGSTPTTTYIDTQTDFRRNGSR